MTGETVYKEQDMENVLSLLYSEDERLNKPYHTTIKYINSDIHHVVTDRNIPSISHNGKWYVQGSSYNMKLNDILSILYDNSISYDMELSTTDTLSFSQSLSANSRKLSASGNRLSSISNFAIDEQFISEDAARLYQEEKEKLKGKGYIKVNVILKTTEDIPELLFLETPLFRR